MKYRINPKNQDSLSQLGFGCMRLGRDEEMAKALFKKAVENGINYFDTAYVYVGNEALLGKALSPFRKDIFLADKLPPYLVRKPSQFERIFTTQLERLKTDSIDYYMGPDLAASRLTTPESRVVPARDGMIVSL